MQVHQTNCSVGGKTFKIKTHNYSTAIVDSALSPISIATFAMLIMLELGSIKPLVSD